jgi:hypothetical protein
MEKIYKIRGLDARDVATALKGHSVDILFIESSDMIKTIKKLRLNKNALGAYIHLINKNLGDCVKVVEMISSKLNPKAKIFWTASFSDRYNYAMIMIGNNQKTIKKLK